MAAEALAFFWWLTVPLAGALVASLFVPSMRGLAGFRRRHWRVLFLGLLPVCILVCGAAFSAAGEESVALKPVIQPPNPRMRPTGRTGPEFRPGAVLLVARQWKR